MPAERIRALRARIARILDSDGPMPAMAGVPFTRLGPRTDPERQAMNAAMRSLTSSGRSSCMK